MSSTYKYVYVPGNYFGQQILDYFHIKTKNALFVGFTIKDFKMSDNVWYLVYWFSFNIKLWITSSHLTNLPENSNIINGITYITKSNKELYDIKKNIEYLDYSNQKEIDKKKIRKVNNEIFEQKGLILKTTIINNNYFV